MKVFVKFAGKSVVGGAIKRTDDTFSSKKSILSELDKI